MVNVLQIQTNTSTLLHKDLIGLIFSDLSVWINVMVSNSMTSPAGQLAKRWSMSLCTIF